jgi:hypothetical protein
LLCYNTYTETLTAGTAMFNLIFWIIIITRVVSIFTLNIPLFILTVVAGWMWAARNDEKHKSVSPKTPNVSDKEWAKYFSSIK